MIFLRQNTAVTLKFGPFVDETDGVTPETGLTITQSDIRLSKNGGSSAQKNDTASSTHDENGYYSLSLNATDTNTLGRLRVMVNESGALPVWDDCMILPANFYDAMVAGSDSLDVNAAEVDGRSTSAGNLADMFDGTGYAEDNAPATQLQVNNLPSAGGRSLIAAVADNNVSGTNPLNGVSFVGTLDSGSISNVNSEDGAYLEIGDSSNNLDAVFRFNIPGNAAPIALLFAGFLNSGNDSGVIMAYDHVGLSWNTIATLDGQSGSSNNSISATLGDSKYSDTGTVYIRIQSTGGSSPQLSIDSMQLEYQNQTAGYAGGQIWVDTINGVSGSTPFANGVADNPVSNWADALLLSADLNIKSFFIRNGSSITLTANSDNYTMTGERWLLDLNGQSIEGAVIEGAEIGTSTGVTTGTAFFSHCRISYGGTTTLGQCELENCLVRALEMSSNGNYVLINCQSGVAGSNAPTLDLNSNDIDLEFRRWSGGLTLNGIASGADISIDVVSGGTVTLNGTGGAVEMRGMVKSIVDNSGGAITRANKAVINDQTIRDANLIPPSAGLSVQSGSIDNILASILADTDISIPALIAALENLNAAQVKAQADQAITDANLATAAALATVDGVVDAVKVVTDNIPNAGALNDLSTAQVKAQADQAITDANLATAAALATVDGLVDAIKIVTDNLPNSGNLTGISSALTTLQTALDDVKGSGFDAANNSLKSIRDRGDAAWTTGSGGGGGGSAPTVQQIRTEMDSNSSQLAAIVAAMTLIDSLVDAIKVVTDNLPNSGSLTGISSALTTLQTALDDIKGSGFASANNSLKSIRDRGDAAWTTGSGGGGGGAGTGARTITITVQDDSSAAKIQNATVRATTAGMETAVATTNASGIAVLSLDDATWTITTTAKSGYNGNSRSLVVNADDSQTIELNAISITAPTAPNLCTVAVTFRLNGELTKGATLKAILTETGSTTDGTILSTQPMIALTDENGYAALELVRQPEFTNGTGKYRIAVIAPGAKVPSIEKIVTIPDQATAWLEDLS